MNRMGHPFDWSARKRRGSGQTAANDPYDQYFHDDADFPHFGSTWDAFNRVGNKRSQHPTESNDRSGFFDYLPQEFRQYMPDNFGFGMRHGAAPPPSSQQPSHQQPSHSQHQQQPYYDQPLNSSKSNLCDAAIQTEDNGQNQERQGNNSYGNNGSSASASSSSTSTPYGNQSHISTSTDGPGAYATASANNPQNNYYQQYYPNQSQGRQYQQQPYSQTPQHQFQHQQSQPTPPPPPPSSASSTPSSQQQSTHGDNFVRNVPIFYEGSNVPVNRTASAQQTASPPTKPRPEPFPCKEPFQQQQPQQQQQSASQPDSAPTEQTSSNDPNPPQTPHTADCIMKIQAIQRDVLDLMCAVEEFGGARGDKEYMYLDEMLTRNLLKLDTIDTNGKDSIRMARKEAIKCIQASIAVLEAKANLNLNGQPQSNDAAVASDDKPTEDGTKADATEDSNTNENKSHEKMDVDETSSPLPAIEKSNDGTNNETNVAAEIPKVQETVENITIGDTKGKENIAAASASNEKNSDKLDAADATEKAN